MHISVTATATDSVVTELSVVTTFIMMCTSLITVTALSVDTAVTVCHSTASATAVTTLSVVTAVTPVCTIMYCYNVVTVIVVSLLSVYITDTLMLLPSLSQCYLGHCCHSTVKYTTVTVLSLPPMSHSWPDKGVTEA